MDHSTEHLILVEDLATKCHCDCLSELRSINNRDLLLIELKRINIDDYSLRDWNDCVGYICNSKLYFSSKVVAYQVLYDFLMSK